MEGHAHLGRSGRVRTRRAAAAAGATWMCVQVMFEPSRLNPDTPAAPAWSRRSMALVGKSRASPLCAALRRQQELSASYLVPMYSVFWQGPMSMSESTSDAPSRDSHRQEFPSPARKASMIQGLTSEILPLRLLCFFCPFCFLPLPHLLLTIHAPAVDQA